MTTLLTIGPPHTITQNVVYALPARRCLLMSSTSGIEQANDVAFTTPVALTLTSGQAEVAGGFIRCTTGNPIISLKA